MQTLTPTNRGVRKVLWEGSNGLRCVESSYAPNLLLPAHDHDHANISLVLFGGLREETDRGVISSGPGCAVMKPPRTTHSNRVGAVGACVFSIEFDSEWIARRRRTRMKGMSDYLWCSHDYVAGNLLRVYACARTAGNGRFALPVQMLRQLELEVQGCVALAPLCTAPSWLASVQDRVQAHPCRVVRINRVACEVGTHPVYLARMFRRCFGSPPIEYMHRVRITQAAFRIASTNDSLCGIALDLGFADQAHLCRRFRSHIGLTPSAFRRLAHAL